MWRSEGTVVYLNVPSLSSLQRKVMEYAVGLCGSRLQSRSSALYSGRVSALDHHQIHHRHLPPTRSPCQNAVPSSSSKGSTSPAKAHRPRRCCAGCRTRKSRRSSSSFPVSTFSSPHETSSSRLVMLMTIPWTTHTHTLNSLPRDEDRTTPIGKMIDAYLRSESELDDHAIHLLFSANRWELACVRPAPLSRMHAPC